jgi:hypothetical protein
MLSLMDIRKGEWKNEITKKRIKACYRMVFN